MFNGYLYKRTACWVSAQVYIRLRMLRGGWVFTSHTLCPLGLAGRGPAFTDSQIQKENLWFPKEKVGEG